LIHKQLKPSLALFVSLPALLKPGLNFYLSMGLSIALTVLCYFLMIAVLNPSGGNSSGVLIFFRKTARTVFPAVKTGEAGPLGLAASGDFPGCRW
jgi:hypothetical protein